MPRRLEIRTTILAKKSEGRAKEKDANANDVYADEALQLLEELQQLKSNMQRTDERILGTYTKSPSKSRKKKKPDSPARKVSYDVVYPSIAAGLQRRDTVVSHCLNPSSVGGVDGDGEDEGRRHDFETATRSGFYSAQRPWASARTNFTPAPAGPSHAAAAAFWPPSSIPVTSTKTTSSPTLAEERNHRAAAATTAAAFRHDGHARRVVDTTSDAASSSSSSSAGGGEERPAGTSRFKRIYATQRPYAPGEIMEATANASHDARDEPVPMATTSQAAGGSDGVGDGDDDRTANAGENTGHASMPLNSSLEPSNHLAPEWFDGAEVDDSFQHRPDDDGNLVAGLVEREPLAEELDDVGRGTPQVEQAVAELEQELRASPVMESRNQKKAERMRHYDREEIRQYMQKQKKERKEKLLSGQQPGYVCQHNRAKPVKRSDMGLPDKPRVVINKRKPESRPAPNKWPEQDWGPYDKPNFVDILTSPTAAQRQKEEKRKASREKCIQTEPVSNQKVDEATQVTARSQIDDDDSTDWLHTVPTTAGRLPQSSQTTTEHPRTNFSSTESTSRSRLLPHDRLVPVVTTQPKPKPVTNLLQKIEDLELYIGNLLEAPTFHTLKTPAAHPVHPVHSTAAIAPARTSYRPSSVTVELPASSFRPPPPPPPPAPTPPVHTQTVPDGPKRVAPPVPPIPPPRISSSAPHQLDTTASTEYHPLPDHLTEFLRLAKPSRDGSSGNRRTTELLAETPKLDSKNQQQPDRRSKFMMEEAELSSLFQLSRPPEVVAARLVESRPPPQQQKQQPPPPGRQEEPQTYFRDFNEILQMDPNPLTERSNSWKRVASRPARSRATDGLPLPAPAPYTILSALSDELKATMNRIPRAADNSSDSDFQSRLSVSDISVPDAVDKTAPVGTATTASSAAPSTTCSRNEMQPPKNVLGSRTVHETGSRITLNPLEHLISGRNVDDPQKNLATDATQIELDTTYMTLTPQYTSFDVTASLAMPLDSTSITDGPIHPAEKEANDRSMFSAKLSPIPRAVSPLGLVSDSESSIHTERKQSTSSSDRSERDRSIGEKIMDESNSRLKTPSPRTVQQQPGGSADGAKKSDELLARLRAEIQRDESLYRSLQHVDRLEDCATKESSKRFRIQIDSKTKTFFEAQTDALRAIAQDVRTGLTPNSAAFLQGSQAAMEVDRVQGCKALDSGRQTYTSDFEEASIRSSPEVPTEIATESIAKSSGQRSPKRPSTELGSDSERGGLDSSALSDASVLPPKAVDVLLQEEAKQQRLLLKLREKAQVEKTLAELELLQMQKRILRAQGERDKAASIKKKQRGLLLKLQEERARIEALRRQHKKEEQRSKASEHHYDSSSWETDWSAASNSTAAADTSASVREVSIADQPDEESSTSTLQPISEAIQGTQADSNDEAIDDEAEVSQPRSEIEGQESGSALSNLRLRAPLSPRTTTESIRLRTKFRRRHSSGSDDSINLSQNETASDVSDVESRLLALTDQLQRRQAEAQRLKIEHRRLSKEKLKAQESALIKQIEVYDRCITDLRTQLDTDAETSTATNAVVAVRPVIRQPRALIRADEAKSPTSARSESEAKIESESAKSLEAEGQVQERKADLSSGTSSISTPIRTEVDECISLQSDHESVREVELLPDAEETIVPVIESAESEKSLSELSTDPSATHENQAETSDCGRADVFNQTMIIKSDSQVKEELAEDISKSILDQLVDETIDLATQCVLKKRKDSKVNGGKSSADVLQRVSALLSSGTDAPKGNRSQMSYLTTTFDLLSPDDLHSPVAPPTNESSFTFAGSQLAPHCDVASAEGRDALESKLNELRFEENEWIDDEMEIAPLPPGSVPDEDRDKVIQEAEALEREQKRIEQEIQRLSAGSVVYMREIPNKPPPPYTPPGQALNWQKVRTPAVVEVKQIIPKSKDDVARYCRRFTEYLLDNHSQLPDVHIPDELFNVDDPFADQPTECQVNCRAFLTLLADLSRLYLSELSKRATFLPGQRFVAGGRPIRSRIELLDSVESSVLVQLNYRPRLLRESQLARWSQKKRDRVDEILVRELQTEERLWTDFSSEEVQVKRQTADAILDFLLDETAFICKRIIQATTE